MTSSHVYERSLPIMAEYGHRPARHVQLVYDAFHVQLGVPEACVFFFCPLTEALFPNHHKPRRSREHVRDRNAMRTEVQMPRELHGMEAGGLRAPVIVFKDSVIRNGYNRCVIFPESERAYLCSRDRLTFARRARPRRRRRARDALSRAANEICWLN